MRKAQENFYEEVLLELKSEGRVGVTRLRGEGRVLQAEEQMAGPGHDQHRQDVQGLGRGPWGEGCGFQALCVGVNLLCLLPIL